MMQILRVSVILLTIITGFLTLYVQYKYVYVLEPEIQRNARLFSKSSQNLQPLKKTPSSGRIGNLLFYYCYNRFTKLVYQEEYIDMKKELPYWLLNHRFSSAPVNYSEFFKQDVAIRAEHKNAKAIAARVILYRSYRRLLREFLLPADLRSVPEKYDVVVHFRCGDALFDPTVNQYSLLPLSYYRDVFSTIQQKDNVVLLIEPFSSYYYQSRRFKNVTTQAYHNILLERNTLVRNFEDFISRLPGVGQVVVQSNSERVDFTALMQARVVVLSVSTFSFWGAFLSAHLKQVHIPLYGTFGAGGSRMDEWTSHSIDIRVYDLSAMERIWLPTLDKFYTYNTRHIRLPDPLIRELDNTNRKIMWVHKAGWPHKNSTVLYRDHTHAGSLNLYHDLRVAFFRLLKTGSTTLRGNFKLLNGNKVTSSMTYYHDHRDLLQRYTWFTVVRDPIMRYFSGFRQIYKKNGSATNMLPSHLRALFSVGAAFLNQLHSDRPTQVSVAVLRHSFFADQHLFPQSYNLYAQWADEESLPPIPANRTFKFEQCIRNGFDDVRKLLWEENLFVRSHFNESFVRSLFKTHSNKKHLEVTMWQRKVMRLYVRDEHLLAFCISDWELYSKVYSFEDLPVICQKHYEKLKLKAWYFNDIKFLTASNATSRY